MELVKKALEKTNLVLLRTERYQHLIYWIVLSVAISIFLYIKGIALPIILVLLLGVMFYYINLMVKSAKYRISEINCNNNSLLIENVNKLVELINSASEKLETQFNTHIADSKSEHSSIKSEILTVGNQLDTTTTALKDSMEDQTTRLEKFNTNLIAKKTEILNNLISKLNNDITDQSKKNTSQISTLINEQTSQTNKSFNELKQQSENDKNQVCSSLIESNEKAIGLVNAKTELIENILNDNLENVNTSIIDSTLKLNQVSVANLEAYTEMLGNLLNELSARQELTKVDVLLAMSLMDTSINNQTSSIATQLNDRTEALNIALSDKSNDLKDVIANLAETSNTKFQDVENKVVSNVSAAKESIGNQIETTISNVIETISKENNATISFVSENALEMISLIDVAKESLISLITENGKYICDELIQNVSKYGNDIDNRLSMLSEEINLSAEETKEHFDSTFDLKISKELGNISMLIKDETSTINENTHNVQDSVIETKQLVETQKTLFSQQLDKLTEELIINITTGLSNYSKKIISSSDDSTDYLENQINSISTKIIDFSNGVASQLEFSKGEYLKLTNNISIIEQHSKTIQDNDLKIIKNQDQLFGDVQSLTSQLNNIRILLNTVQSSNNVKVERKSNVEVIEDKANNLKINNTYHGDLLRKSEMHSSGKLKYYVEYDNQGKMRCSKNFDLNGNVLTEIFYYSNEQVKERIEWTKLNGKPIKTVTRYDESGNKK